MVGAAAAAEEAGEVRVGINLMKYVLANSGMQNLTDGMLWS